MLLLISWMNDANISSINPFGNTPSLISQLINIPFICLLIWQSYNNLRRFTYFI